MFLLRGMPPATLSQAWWAAHRRSPRPRHVFLCIADHFEPMWRRADTELQAQRVLRWREQYPRSVEGLADHRGRPPQHSFFYPIECFEERWIEQLAKLAHDGYGDVEIHLHHDADTAESLRQRLSTAAQRLHDEFDLLSKDTFGQIRFGFIHGNWALDNSHPTGRWCGVNDELTVLLETGCYADFTMPAAPHAAQTRTINSIYYAFDDPERPKSHDRGQPARRHVPRPGQGLLMIQGPLGIHHRSRWCMPKIENGNLSGTQPPSIDRFSHWLRASVVVQGQSEWCFIKLHTHGAQEPNSDVLLGEAMRKFHIDLCAKASRDNFRYYYVTAREMAQLVHQAEAGLDEPDFETLSWPV